MSENYTEIIQNLLFQKYGNGRIITFEGLEHLLKNLGLGQAYYFGHSVKKHLSPNGTFVEFHESHKHIPDIHNHHTQTHTHSHDSHSHTHSHLNQTAENLIKDKFHLKENKTIAENYKINITKTPHEMFKCLSASEILEKVNMENKGELNKENFFQLCPFIIYQLEQHVCSSVQLESSHKKLRNKDFNFIPWFSAILTAVIISLIGLFFVCIIPYFSKKPFIFTLFLQFLVALAIGTMVSDALIHLMPHAMIPHIHDNTISNIPYYYEDEDINENDNSKKIKRENYNERLTNLSKDAMLIGMVVLLAVLFFFLLERSLKIISRKKKRSQQARLYKTCEMNNLSNEGKDHFKVREVDVKNNSFSFQEKMEEEKDLSSNHHHHSHSQGILSNAWMVAIGDALHNFTDGLAIGSSFSNSLSVGLSTSVAIICHELPHELGDFAVLIESGMKVSQAIKCNIVSSVLCLIGVFAGLMQGTHLESFTSWIFAITAGSFIYIAFVDMIPQLLYSMKYKNENNNESLKVEVNEKNNKEEMEVREEVMLLLQLSGILLGFIIMFVIAVYEDEIKINFNFDY